MEGFSFVQKIDDRVTDKYDNPTRRLLIAIERGQGLLLLQYNEVVVCVGHWFWVSTCLFRANMKGRAKVFNVE